MEHEARERVKREGWSLFHNVSLPPETRSAGLLDVIRAHYDHSLEAWAAKPNPNTRRHPHCTWEEYIANWLYVNGARKLLAKPGNEPLIRKLQEKYPPPKHPVLGKGYSYWG